MQPSVATFSRVRLTQLVVVAEDTDIGPLDMPDTPGHHTVDTAYSYSENLGMHSNCSDTNILVGTAAVYTGSSLKAYVLVLKQTLN